MEDSLQTRGNVKIPFNSPSFPKICGYSVLYRRLVSLGGIMVEVNSYFDSPVPSKDYKRLFRDGYG